MRPAGPPGGAACLPPAGPDAGRCTIGPGGAGSRFQPPAGRLRGNLLRRSPLARAIGRNFPASLDGAPFLLPLETSRRCGGRSSSGSRTTGSALRWSASSRTARCSTPSGRRARGLRGTVRDEDEMRRRYGVAVVGRTERCRNASTPSPCSAGSSTRRCWRSARARARNCSPGGKLIHEPEPHHRQPQRARVFIGRLIRR